MSAKILTQLMMLTRVGRAARAIAQFPDSHAGQQGDERYPDAGKAHHEYARCDDEANHTKERPKVCGLDPLGVDLRGSNYDWASARNTK